MPATGGRSWLGALVHDRLLHGLAEHGAVDLPREVRHVGGCEDRERGYRAAAVLALVGFVNVPIIKFSVDWWNTLHQPASVVRMDGPSIHPDMLWPLLLMAVGFTLYYVTLLLVGMKRELVAARVRALEINAVRRS